MFVIGPVIEVYLAKTLLKFNRCLDLLQGAIFVKTYAARMKAFFLILFGGVITGFFMLGCQDSGQHPAGQDKIQVKVPSFHDGRYRLETKTLDTVHDLRQLRGEAARFLYAPGYENGQLVGQEPRLRFMKNKDGVYVAQDSLSLQLITMYAQLEELMKLDERLGIKSLNQWPRLVAYNVQVTNGDPRMKYNNALYSGQLDSFLFVPYTRSELPLAVNAGVVAHEHFHSLFYKLVLKKLGGFFVQTSSTELHQDAVVTSRIDEKRSSAEVYHVSLLRAFNEGLADVWGWVATGDSDFVNRSLGFEKARGMDIEDRSPIPTASEWVEKIQGLSMSDAIDLSYPLGAQYAKLIKQTTSLRINRSTKHGDNQAEIRFETAVALIRTLAGLKDAVAQLGKGELLRPSILLEILSRELPGMDSKICKDLSLRTQRESAAKICKNQKEGG